jgi:hypothetical protein
MMFITIGYNLYTTYMVPFAEAKGIAGIGAFFTVLPLP